MFNAKGGECMKQKSIVALLSILLILFACINAYSENSNSLITFTEIENNERENIYYRKIAHKKSEADTFIESLDEIMKEELVRSVISENDEQIMAKMLWGEDRINPTYMRAAIIWCVYNRMDAGHETIENIINQTSFPGYRESHPVKEWAIDLIRDVTIRYVLELNGFKDVGRVLPKEYLYYEQPEGKIYHIFKTKLRYSDPDNKIWDWSLPSPYDD